MIITNWKYQAMVALLFVGLASGCAKESDPVKRGEKIFAEQNCLRCHAFNESGVNWGPDLTLVGFRRSQEWLDLWLKEPRAWHPVTAMPTFKLTDDQRADLSAFLAAQKGQAWGQERPWNRADAPADPAQKGKMIFDKAGCVGCHGQGGKGGYPNNNVIGGQIPALLLAADGYSKEELIDRIKKGVVPVPQDPNAPAPMVHMPVWQEFLNDEEIGLLAEYIYSIRPAVKSEEEW